MGYVEDQRSSLHDNIHVKSKRSIRNRVAYHKKTAELGYLDGHPLEVQVRLEQDGFTKVNLNNIYDWKELHEWCKEIIGIENYVWFGSIFWFSDEQDALLFELRWNNNEHHQIKI